MSKGKVGGVVLGVIIVVFLFCLMKLSVRVPAGYVAIKYNANGGVTGETLDPGWHIISPMEVTTLYSVGIEQSYLTAEDKGDSPKDESFTASSSEGKSLGIELTFTYQYQKDHAAEIFNKFKGQSGKEVRDIFIKPNVISWTKEVIARYKVSDILGSERADVNAALTEYLAQKFEPYGISISNVSLINIEVDEETQQAINNKITAQQNAETQSINNQTAIDKASANAEVQKTEAQELIQTAKIDKWNGEVPTVQGSDATTIIDASDLIKDTEETE